MASIVRGSAASTNRRRGPVPSGDQSPILTVYGNPPQLIRVENEDYLDLAQAIADRVGRIFVVTSKRTLVATRNQPTPAGQGSPQTLAPSIPGGILQADQLPPAQNGHAPQQAVAGMCPRCGGSKVTAGGRTCPVCGGKGVTR
jgi:hypothetical protein